MLPEDPACPIEMKYLAIKTMANQIMQIVDSIEEMM